MKTVWSTHSMVVMFILVWYVRKIKPLFIRCLGMLINEWMQSFCWFTDGSFSIGACSHSHATFTRHKRLNKCFVGYKYGVNQIQMLILSHLPTVQHLNTLILRQPVQYITKQICTPWPALCAQYILNLLDTPYQNHLPKCLGGIWTHSVKSAFMGSVVCWCWMRRPGMQSTFQQCLTGLWSLNTPIHLHLKH